VDIVLNDILAVAEKMAVLLGEGPVKGKSGVAIDALEPKHLFVLFWSLLLGNSVEIVLARCVKPVGI
jgi:hypothetical protein